MLLRNNKMFFQNDLGIVKKSNGKINRSESVLRGFRKNFQEANIYWLIVVTSTFSNFNMLLLGCKRFGARDVFLDAVAFWTTFPTKKVYALFESETISKVLESTGMLKSPAFLSIQVCYKMEQS